MKKGEIEAKDELYFVLLGLIEKEKEETIKEITKNKEKKLTEKVF